MSMREKQNEWNEGIVERINYELFYKFNPMILNPNPSKDFQIAACVGCPVRYVRKIKQLL